MDNILALSEEDIKLRYITPSILQKGWSVEDITMETKVKLTDGKPLKTLIDYAKEQRMATGIVSANSLMEGSLAPFVAHVENRMQLEEIAKAYVEKELLQELILRPVLD